jgi:acyl-coenzyme A thioesterase PaaI-like protein
VAWIERSWGSGAGTHGGYLAALGLAAMRARLVGELGEDRPVRALVTHFLAPVADRPLDLHAAVERVGRDAAVCPGRSPAFTRSTASAATSDRRSGTDLTALYPQLRRQATRTTL